MADFLTRLAQRTLTPTPQVQPRLAPMYATVPALPVLEAVEAEPASPTLEALEVEEERETRAGETPPAFRARPATLRDPDARRFESPLETASERPASGATPLASVVPPQARAAAPVERLERHETLPRHADGATEALATASGPPIETRVLPVSTLQAPAEGAAGHAPPERPEAAPAAWEEGPGAAPAVSEARPAGAPLRQSPAPSRPPELRPAEPPSRGTRRRVGALAPSHVPRLAVEGAAARGTASADSPGTRIIEYASSQEETRASSSDAPVPVREAAEVPAGAVETSARPDMARPALPAERRAPPAEGSAAPVVRVTIGRVEVRAVTPPAPVRPAVALSLDDYLKRFDLSQR